MRVAEEGGGRMEARGIKGGGWEGEGGQTGGGGRAGTGSQGSVEGSRRAWVGEGD